MSICINCEKEIPLNHAQVGGVHITCEWQYYKEKSQLMFKFRPLDCTPWVVVEKVDLDRELSQAARSDLESETETVFEVLPVMMTKYEKANIDKLTEFQGW